jgi:hypothetical protein
MGVLSVSYDLRQPGRNYQPLYDALARYQHCHALESLWFIDTGRTCAQVRGDLCGLVDRNDQVYVIRLHRDWAACQGEPCTEWLNDPSRTWD